MMPILSVSLRRFLSWLLIAGGLVAINAFAQVGTIQFAAGDVKIRDAAGVERTAAKGMGLNAGDTILTGTGVSSAQIKMVDEGIIAVRPESQLKIDQYAFKGKEDGSERAFMSLLKGGFRAITGLIGRTNRDNYRVTTPNATIGIRGTDFEPYYVTQDVQRGKPVAEPGPAAATRLAQAALAQEIQIDIQEAPVQLAQATPAAAIVAGSTVARVNRGSIGLRPTIQPAALLVVGANQAGLATPDGRVSIIPIPAEIFRATPQPVKPAAKAPADKPAADEPAVAEKPAVDKPAVAEKPAADKPAVAEKPAADKPAVAEKPAPPMSSQAPSGLRSSVATSVKGS